MLGPWPAERTTDLGRLEDIWKMAIRDVGKPSPTCSVSSGVKGSCWALGFQTENVPRQQQQLDAAFFRVFLWSPAGHCSSPSKL